MVLKKPYAFLIKHFKLIHLVLCIPFIYLIIKTGAIANFFSTYIAANYYTSIVNVPGTYINYFMYGAILLVVLLSLSIYFLMRQKEKNTKFYMFIMIYYIFLLVILSLCHSILGSIETASIAAQTVRVYRDIAYIIYIPQFLFTGYTILRGIGFDLKKFNFDEDVRELEITDIDSEEFELEFGANVDEYKRTARRFLREFRYYVLENRFTFAVLSSIIIAVIGTMLYLNFGVYNKTYRQTQNVSHNNLIVNVNDSVLTRLDVGGKNISGKYYLALSLKIKNNGKVAKSLDYENFQLEISKRMISATLDRANYFPDLGIPYTRDTSIAPGAEGIYVLTYEIDEALIDQKISLKILDSLTFEIGSVTPIYKTVNLKYDKVFENKEVKTVELGKYLELSNTFLGMTRLQIKDYNIVKSYEYRYEKCTSIGCQTLNNKIVSNDQKTLFVLSQAFQMDTYTNYYVARKGSNAFVNDFLQVRYTTMAGTNVTGVSNVTPRELTDMWVLEVPESLENASRIDILITLRGSTYVMKVK